MHDPDQKKHAILSTIVYNPAYNIGEPEPILPPGWAPGPANPGFSRRFSGYGLARSLPVRTHRPL